MDAYWRFAGGEAATVDGVHSAEARSARSSHPRAIELATSISRASALPCTAARCIAITPTAPMSSSVIDIMTSTAVYPRRAVRLFIMASGRRRNDGGDDAGVARG